MCGDFSGLTRLAGPEVFKVLDFQVPVSEPSGAITVRVYTPQGDGPFPVHVNTHGGM